MFERKFLGIELNGYWRKAVLISVTLFFVFLGDAIMSDWVPAFVQESVSSPFLMGLIISSSSVVGFLSDLIFPQLLKGLKTKKLLVMAIGTSLVFCGLMLWSTALPWIGIFLIAMAVWGVYYEFLGFGTQMFVSENVPTISRSGVWAVMSSFKSLAYFIGPIIGSYVAINKGNGATVWVATLSVGVGYIAWLFMGRSKKEVVVGEPVEKINIFLEIKHWITLFEHVWPILIVSIFLGIVDATYWTTGTVFSDNLSKQEWFGGLFLPFYVLPMVFMGGFMAKLGIYKGKKKMAECFMLLSGLLLVLLGISSGVIFSLVISFLVGSVLSISWPLVDAVYSDIVSRMGKEGKHMMGLSGSTLSLAYVVGPILSGGIAQYMGERLTFVVVGGLMVVVSVALLLVTPKKLRLPQEEIKAWDS